MITLRKLAMPLIVTVLMGVGLLLGQNANFPGGGGGSTVLTTLPGYGTTLMGWYQIKPTETNTALVDYSTNGRTAVGSVGTAPTIVPVTGGLACNAAGGITLPTALNSAKTIMFFMQNGAQIIARSAPIAGTGTTWVALTNFLPTNSNAMSPADADSTSGRTTTRNSFWMTGTIAHVFGTNNTIYQNGIQWSQNYFSSTNGSSAGIQVDGNYSICGAQHSTNSGYVNTGSVIYQVAFWSDVETASQMAAADQVMTNLEVAAGVYKSNFNNTNDTTYQILGTGDSIGAGAGITTPVFANSSSTGSLTLTDTWSQSNLATSGFTAFNISNSVPSFISQLRPQAAQNLNAIWAGTNDMATDGKNGAQIAGYQANNCRQTKVAITAAKCMVFTIADVTGFDTQKNSIDTTIRQKWTTYADILVDIAGDPNMGCDGCAANTLYFLDGKHPTQHASYNDLTPMVQRATNRSYAPQGFSTARVVVAAAAAASAVTATSESTNTMTFTTALNPPVGSSVICTGITPAGYNSPNTGWLVLTTGGASFTAYNGTTGLGAGSAFGTCSVPTQQDGDVYTTLNFGAGNFTLESCMGYTDQYLYIKNINAGTSAVVPFAAETIDGSSSVNVAQNALLILQAKLTSSAAGGCTWTKVQNN